MRQLEGAEPTGAAATAGDGRVGQDAADTHGVVPGRG